MLRPKVRLGVHTSIAGGIHKGIERAHALGCSTLQFFSHNPRGWAFKDRDPEECAAFRNLRAEHDISPAFIHTSYLINLASSSPELLKRSVSMVMEELAMADVLGAEYVVLHTGSASADDPGKARERVIGCLRKVAEAGQWKSGLLLENTAGERGDTTSRIAEIADVIDRVPGGLISGICIDTCHAFAAGYDLSGPAGIDDLASEIESNIGRDRLKLIHLNDSRCGVGARVDRHAHIGEGKLGIDAIRAFVRHPFFSGVPLILETPKKTDEDDPRNLKIVRGLLI